jgi:hypothetical protein
VILHGSAVAVDGRAIALVGGRGAGKSTTAYALVREGATLVADDLTVLVDGDGPPRIEGGDSRVRLNLDAAALNGESLNGASGDHEALEREHAWPPLDKREVPLPTHRADSLPLSAIYVLGSREPEGVTEVTEEAPPLALTSLMSNRYATYILGPSDHARDFAALARLAGQVPVYRVRRTDSLDDLPGLARTLLQHARQVPAV